MEKQRERARAASTFKMAEGLDYRGAKTKFDGYDTLAEEARVVALYRDGTPVDALSTGQSGVVVLDRTPFYAESGGQVGDRGEITKEGACLTLFAVHDTQKIQPDVFGHYGEVRTGELKLGDTVAAKVDGRARARAAWNHSATHLMHAALRKVLGDHVTQKGSLVDPDRTRFDFSHPQPMTDEEIRTVESLVNAAIRANYPVEARIMPYDEAIKSGAMALFGEKYGDEVRVLTHGRLFDRALRRHPRQSHRRHRLLQDRVRIRRRGRHSPRRSGHRRGRARLYARNGSAFERSGARAQGASHGGCGEDRADPRQREGAGERACALERASSPRARAAISPRRRSK